jgi:predicted ATP-grasp superfamily ATP-dependent carboligase
MRWIKARAVCCTIISNCSSMSILLRNELIFDAQKYQLQVVYYGFMTWI